MVIRPLRPDDESRAEALFGSIYPWRADEFSTWRCNQLPEFPFRLIAEASPQRHVIAYGAIRQERETRFRLDLLVAPGWRRRGLGGRLLERLMRSARAAGAATLQARSESDWTDSLTFLERRGFAETMRMHHQLLRVADATLGRRVEVEGRMAWLGVTITSVADEQAREPRCWERYHELFVAAGEGWPDPDPGPGRAVLTLDEFQSAHRSAQRQLGEPEEACWLAVCDGAYLGFTSVMGTGVHPAHRGLGIGSALKLRAVAWARDHGVETMRTATGNPVMLRINEQLGFRQTSTEVRLVRRLAT